jgi:uncharacterized protein YecT (DUF1311 family)
MALMSADDEREPQGRDYLGFHAYADDTPRYDEAAPSWVEAGPRPAYGAELRDGPAPRRAGVSRSVAVAGMALAAGAAALIAWNLGPRATSRGAGLVDAPADAPGARAQAQLQITSASPESAPPAPAAPVSVLPTTPAPAINAVPVPPRAPTGLAVPAGALQPLPPAPEIRPAIRTPPPLQAQAQAPPQPAAPAACAYARSPGDLFVCNDPELAAADRQMVRAYRAAIAAGAPEAALSREQRSWLDARDDAAHRSRREVENLYAQRLRDLADWRDEARDREDR